MQAKFLFKGDEEIIVSTSGNDVVLQCSRGITGAHGSGPETVVDTWAQTYILPLSKSEARSIASAMMGAAAEL